MTTSTNETQREGKQAMMKVTIDGKRYNVKTVKQLFDWLTSNSGKEYMSYSKVNSQLKTGEEFKFGQYTVKGEAVTKVHKITYWRVTGYNDDSRVEKRFMTKSAAESWSELQEWDSEPLILKREIEYSDLCDLMDVVADREYGF